METLFGAVELRDEVFSCRTKSATALEKAFRKIFCRPASIIPHLLLLILAA